MYIQSKPVKQEIHTRLSVGAETRQYGGLRSCVTVYGLWAGERGPHLNGGTERGLRTHGH